MLIILGKASSINVRKVLWVCEIIGIPYQLEPYGSGTANSVESAEFLALNPHGMVPVMIDDDFVLVESNTICRYLAAKYQRSDLLPAGPAERAQVEKWMDWQISDLNSAWRYAFMAIARQSPLHRDAELLHRSCVDWNRHMRVIEQHLETHSSFLTGSQLSLADIVIGLSIHRWKSTALDHPSFPNIEAYYLRLSELPGFVAHVANGYP
jgi:glutathione S-transferase